MQKSKAVLERESVQTTLEALDQGGSQRVKGSKGCITGERAPNGNERPYM